MSRRNYRYEMAVLTSLLKQWGSCLEKFYNFSGLPSSDILYKAIFGHSGDGSGLPIPDCPTAVVQLCHRINALKEWDRAVLTAKFAMNLSPTGFYTDSEKAARLGLRVEEFYSDIRQAKERLLITFHQKDVAKSTKMYMIRVT